MRLVSWNVNGIRAAVRKGFLEWLVDDRPDILCLQETRIQPEQIPDDLQEPGGYLTFWQSAQKKGYSGVATFCQQPPQSIQRGFGRPDGDDEGRVIITDHDSFTLVNAYFPNGRRSQERVQFKLQFYDDLLAFCQDLQKRGKRPIVCGDFNTAHSPIDLARPKENQRTSGFLPEEREALDRWLQGGFVDAFRHLYPEAQEYSWWTYRFNARTRNIGWRLDYHLVAEEFLSCVQDAQILSTVTGSDHCPVELRLAL